MRSKAEDVLRELKGVTLNDHGKAVSKVKNLLHGPCIKIRRGNVVDETDVLLQIREALEE